MIIFIFLLFALASAENDGIYIGVYHSDNLSNVKIPPGIIPPFRLHFKNSSGTDFNWKQQSDGISITLYSSRSHSHIALWNYLIELFDTIPSDSTNYNIELKDCPKPLYLEQIMFNTQCNSIIGDNNASEGSDEHFDQINGVEYKNIAKYRVSENDKGNNVKFGIQKSCLQDYTSQNWDSKINLKSDFAVLSDLFNKAYILLLIPKLLEVRYNFKQRIINFILDKIDKRITIANLYWFNMIYDGTKLKVTFSCKFKNNNSEVLKLFAFKTNDISIINNNVLNNLGDGSITQSIIGVGSHKQLKIKLNHSQKDRPLKIVHFLDNSVFVDPSQVKYNSHIFTDIQNCSRDLNKDFDDITVTANSIEDTRKGSPVQVIEVTICPPNQSVEYTLPIHARYMPICKFGSSCTGYEYALITAPSVYYMSTIEEDVVLFDSFELAKILQFMYDVSFIKYITSDIVYPFSRLMSNNKFNLDTNSMTWTNIVLRSGEIEFKLLPINYVNKTAPCYSQFEEDYGFIYNTFTLTCGKLSDFFFVRAITILTSALLTLITIIILLSGGEDNNSNNCNSHMFGVLGRMASIFSLKNRSIFSCKGRKND